MISPVPLVRRSLPGQLRSLASQLLAGADPDSIALALESVATAMSLEEAALGHQENIRLRERLEHAEAALARDSEGIRLWMLDCAEVASRNRQRADKAEAEVQRLRAELDAAREDRDWLERQRREGA